MKALGANFIAAMRPRIASALAPQGSSMGAETHCERLAPALAMAPSAQVVRWMVVVGWASACNSPGC